MNDDRRIHEALRRAAVEVAEGASPLSDDRLFGALERGLTAQVPSNRLGEQGGDEQERLRESEDERLEARELVGPQPFPPPLSPLADANDDSGIITLNRSTKSRPFVVAGLLVAAGIGAVFWWTAPGSSDRPVATESHTPGAREALVQTVHGQQVAPCGPDACPELSHCRVSSSGGAQVRWHPARHSAELLSGSVLVEVDPRAGRPFSISTARFRAEVLGTAFAVTAETVSVTRGRVRVVPMRGAPRVLGPGDTWRVQSMEPEAVQAEQPAAKAAARSASEGPSIDERLREVRALIAKKQYQSAERVLARVKSRKLDVAQSAEAGSLEAELALAQGNAGQAAKLFEGVARSTDPRAAENALYAAGRSEYAAGNSARAKQLFQRYLSEYPDGQFAPIAEKRLRELDR